MTIAPVTAEEAIRLRALYTLGLLDTPPEERFDRLTRLAGRHFSVPITLISLIDEKRQWFKSSYGLELKEMNRTTAFCAYTILKEGTLVLSDVQDDPRFIENPLVIRQPSIRFYAGHPIHSPDGSRVGTFCIMDRLPRQLNETDLAELKDFAILAEQELQNLALFQQRSFDSSHHEQEFRAIVENTSDVVARFDKAGRYLYVNQAIEKLTGVPPNKLIGKTPHEGMAVPPHVDQHWQDKVKQIFEFGQEMDCEFKYVTSANIQKSHHIRLIPEYAKDGTVESIFAIRQDLTDTKLWSNYGQLTSVLESITDAFFILNHQGEFTYLNPKTEQIMQHAHNELLGKNLWEVFPDAKETVFYQIYQDAMQQKLPVHFEEFYPPIGCWIEVHVHPYSEGLLVYFRDISQRKQLEEDLHKNEEQLRQALKMEAVGRLAGGIAHDFNNLLTVITSYSDLILSGLDEYDPLFLDLAQIKDAAVRATGLTRQLLAFSRREALQPKVLDLNEVVAEMKKLLQRLIGENIELITMPAPRLGRIKSDPGQLEQVIVNLAINGRDAMPRGGKLLIETINVDLDREDTKQHPEIQPGKYVMLSVSDTGSGMDEAVRSHIFEPFFTTKELGHGTGLGLSTVYGIVKRNGGFIEVSSKVNRGTCFKIYLPQVEEPNDFLRSGVRLTNNLPCGSETILLVEDDDAVRSLANKVLNKCGYNILEAQNGSEALLLCKRYRGTIDLLLTDIVMPWLNGRELAQQLIPLQPQMKVLYISGYTGQVIADQASMEEKGIFLQKPFTPLELTYKVREVITSNSL